MREIFVRAPATIANVGPGFDIFAFALERPFDLFRVALNPVRTGTAVVVPGGESDIPEDPDRNTAGLAARRLIGRLGYGGGVDIEIHKRMPACAGLGSSAASAAASVFGLNRLLEAGLDSGDLVEAARYGEIASGGTAHADNVAACLCGGFVFIRREGPLELVNLAMPPVSIVVRVQKKSQVTTRGQIPPHFSLAEVKRQMSLCAEVVRAVTAGDAEAFGAAINEDLISEPVRSKSIPGYGTLKSQVLRAGAWGCNVSGGGSSVFAVAPAGNCQDVASVMRSFRLPDGDVPEVIVTKSSDRGAEVIDGL